MRSGRIPGETRDEDSRDFGEVYSDSERKKRRQQFKRSSALDSRVRCEMCGVDGAVRPDAPAPVKPRSELTNREKEVLYWLAQGKRGSEIGDLLGISVCTVRVHIRHVIKKLNASTIAHAVALGYRAGILSFGRLDDRHPE